MPGRAVSAGRSRTGGSRLALAGRAGPPLRIARLRAEGRILEIGPGDLSLTCEEASSLLRNAGLTLGEEEVAELHQRTEGWPAGLYLAALYLREGGPFASAAVSFGGDDRLVSEYMESEFLSRISRRQRVFLTRTAVLERMCGPLCDAVLELGGSAAVLAELAGSNLLLVPLDRRGEWYRYHHLFRDMLLAELERREPGLIPVLRRRAAGWCLDNGMPEEALEYCMAAGDADGAARLVGQLTVPVYRQGRVTTIQRWFGWLEDHGGIGGHPMTAVLAALFSAPMGRPVETERWADAVDRWQYGDPARPDDPTVEAWAALMRALLCRGGVEQMRADADEAVRRFAAESFVTPTPALRRESHASCAVTSMVARCRWRMRSAPGSKSARPRISRSGCASSHCWRSHAVSGTGRGPCPKGRQGSAPGRDRGKLRDAPGLRGASPHRPAPGRPPRGPPGARPCSAATGFADLRGPGPGCPGPGRARPRSLRAIDLAGARTLMREVDELLRRGAGLGTLAAQAGALRAQLSRQRDHGLAGASALTAAELRLLPRLPTHLPLPEIAAKMFLSRTPSGRRPSRYTGSWEPPAAAMR